MYPTIDSPKTVYVKVAIENSRQLNHNNFILFCNIYYMLLIVHLDLGGAAMASQVGFSATFLLAGLLCIVGCLVLFVLERRSAAKARILCA